MTTSSEDLEAFLDRLRSLDRELGKLGAAEVKNPELVNRLGAAARDWLKQSEGLRAGGLCRIQALDDFDRAFREVLRNTSQRSRASAYRKRLSPVLGGFLNDIVVQVIRFEGSPVQVAGRQVEAFFDGLLQADEAPYIEEAGRCVASKCYRAAIIMIWAATVARLHRGVESLGFSAFNSAASTAAARKGGPCVRLTKNLAVTSLPELQRTRDFDLLVVGMELWGYDLQVFEELERMLGVRNGASHPDLLGDFRTS